MSHPTTAQSTGSGHRPDCLKRELRITVDGVTLPGSLLVPKGAVGVVVFAHGSGSSRFSPRNAFVAERLQGEKIGTLLIDLLTAEEDEDYETRFDIGLLARRLKTVVAWITEQSDTKSLPIGLFGASTGAAAALAVAGTLGGRIAAVVSRGGRPDLARSSLSAVVSPTLLIVGGADPAVRAFNEDAFTMLACEKKLEVVPGATHLFEEPGALKEVARLAAEWFARFLRASHTDREDLELALSVNEAEEGVPSMLKNRMEKPTRPPGKTRAGAKEGYRHLHRK